MTNLKNLTDEELQAELTRRAAIKNAPPTPLENPDFSELTKCVIDGVTDAVKRQYLENDVKQYVWEAALTAVYGKSYWDWRKQQKW